jgi:hypothetical protein
MLLNRFDLNANELRRQNFPVHIFASNAQRNDELHGGDCTGGTAALSLRRRQRAARIPPLIPFSGSGIRGIPQAMHQQAIVSQAYECYRLTFYESFVL